MPVYEVETDKGTFEIELDRELSDTPANRALLQQLVVEQLRYRAAAGNTPGSLAEQALGGVRDYGQQLLDLPASIANTVTEYISPDAPGGPRRRVVPAVQAPQLPDVAAPATGLEKGVRMGATVATGLATGAASPAVRRALRLRLFGPEPPVRSVPLMLAFR